MEDIKRAQDAGLLAEFSYAKEKLIDQARSQGGTREGKSPDPKKIRAGNHRETIYDFQTLTHSITNLESSA